MGKIEHWYLHVDLDAFFASVEQLDHPEYRGKPVIVGGKPEDRRSVVSTASYEARKYGVHSAMPTFQAYKLCPNGIYVHGRMDRYAELSFIIMNIFKNYSPDVTQMSIDEAFIDITGTEKLFGHPLETAKKIKNEVFEKTGLTVSIGIAPTKYLAKIASGFQKPNGITFINQGEEESFMLNLPLNKVWGLGPKSLDLINSKGIKTTRDIYEMPIENLQFMFGKNMGNYLYEVVRGNEKETFSREAKNHSISSESTYPYDLTDTYTIETELLELAHGVFFRLLKEDSFSRTAFVKIRYDDFTTVSIQETLERNIVTLDTYFETLKRLFEKKYETGRGIRLLGVGFENIKEEEGPQQQDLFDNRDEKKQAVEKAILNLEKKHPEIKVRKARTFKSILMIFLLSLIPIKTEAQNIKNTTAQQGAGTTLPDTLYIPSDNKNENDQKLSDEERLFEYEIEGFYQADFTTGLAESFGTNIDSTFSWINPVFIQEVDISALIKYKQNWYFQAEFADKFERNTLTMGYSDDFIKAKISNRNIEFPAGYSSEVFGFSPKGGQNQAPGFSINLTGAGNKWNADFLFRYDMTESHSATYYGFNKVSDSYISPENFVYGQYFIFPENTQNSLSEVSNIYIENSNGEYKDSRGKKYKKLSVTEYAVLANEKKILISANAGGTKKNGIIPSIIITFNSNSAVTDIINKTGNYNEESSFAGTIQKSLGSKYDLTKYNYEPSTKIENNEGLIIQNSSGFSPYLTKNLYDCGLTANGELLVVSKNSDTILRKYKVSPWEDSYTSLYEDFFHEKHHFALVTNIDDPVSNYPFGDIAPEIYLNLDSGNDISLLIRNYSPVKELSIGTKASAGTVQVYRNGSIESGAIYNPETGVIILSSAIVNTDKIYIIWQEEANDYNNGSITAASGFKINFNQFLSGDISLTSQWPVSAFINSNNKFSTIDNYKNGYGALTAGINYKSDNFSFSDKTNIAIVKENASNNLLVCSQEQKLPSTFYLNSSSGYNTYSDIFINTPERQLLLLNKDNCSTNNHAGIKDSSISGYSIPLQWDFSKSETPWASVDIKLPEGNLLKSSSKLEIALKTNIPSQEFSNYEFYLQLGINADEEFHNEDKEKIPAWKLTLKNSMDWQQVSILLNDIQRSELASYTDARLIVVPVNGKAVNSTGSIYIGPYEPFVNPIFTSYPEELILSSYTTAYNSDFYSSYINWHLPAGVNLKSIHDPFIYTTKNFKPADFSNYGSINLDFAISNINTLKILLTDGTNTSVDLEILDISAYNNNLPKYHTLSINVKDNEVYIDDNKLPAESYKLYISNKYIPSVEKLIIPVSETGFIYIGNLYYKDTDFIVSAKNYTQLDYQKDFEVVKVQATFNSIQSSGAFSNPDFNITSYGKTTLTSHYASIQGDISVANDNINNAGHIVKTESPLFNALSVSEDYRYSKADKSLTKKDSIVINLSKYNIPLASSFQTTAKDTASYQTQNINNEFIFDYKNSIFGIGNSINIDFSQKTNTYIYTEDYIEKDNYFTGWKDISSLQFSNGNSNAFEREEKYQTKLFSNLPLGNLSPSITYSISGLYRNSDTVTLQDKENIQLSIPFSFSDNSVSVNISRYGSGTASNHKGIDYSDDTKAVFSIQQERDWFYKAIPIYDLFSTQLKEDVTENYSTKYETIYKRKLSNSLQDLYIPSSASFAVTRDIKASDSIKDLYQYKAVITNTSINNLGSESVNQFFSWFKQEEIITSLTGILKVPYDIPENTTFQITGYVQTLFMITDNCTLTTAVDGSIVTNNNWSTHGTFIYSRKSDISLIKSLFCLIIPKLCDINFEITRKDLLNIDVSRISNINKQIYSVQHNVEHKFLQHYTVSTGIGGSFTYLEKQANKVDLNIKLGFKAEF